MKKLARQFVGFASVGGIATGIQYTLLIVLREFFGVYAVYASAIAYAISAVLNYLMKYHWVFSSQCKHREAAPRYASISLLGLGLNTSAMYLLAGLAGWHYLIAQVCATALVLVWGFFASALWTFKC